jgi:KUP system potassium uptake protein
MEKKGSRLAEVIKALGLVFGDIGTSPNYTLTVIFLFTKHSAIPSGGCFR